MIVDDFGGETNPIPATNLLTGHTPTNDTGRPRTNDTSFSTNALSRSTSFKDCTSTAKEI